VADHAPSSQEAAKREATLLFADLSRKGSTAEEIEAREYYQKLDSGYVGRGDAFKGKALLAHGQMFLEGEGGDADYDAALSKLNDARRFTNVKEKASEVYKFMDYETHAASLSRMF
jgi:TPR repeat protein